MPRGKRTRSPRRPRRRPAAAPAPRGRRGTRGRPPRGSCRRWLDDREAFLAEHLERRQRPRQERLALDLGVEPAARRARGHRSGGRRASRSSVLPRCRRRAVARGRRRRRARPGRAPASARRTSAPGSSTTAEVRDRRDAMRERHRVHEVLLEPRLHRGLDLLDAPHDAFDLAPRGAADSRAISAPVPAALPAALTWARPASGMSPRTIAWKASIWLPNAPGEPDLVHRLDRPRGPSAAARPRTARPWRAGSPARRSV